MTGGPSLLVSVRNAAEADDALEGGADWIDLKEPLRGPLGAVDHTTASEVVERVRGRVPVSAACGELIELPSVGPTELAALHGLRLLKFGTAGCDQSGAWRDRLQEAVAWTHGNGKLFALGAYADWRQAGSPPPQEVLAAAASAGADWLLLDTFNKDGTGLLGLMSSIEVGILASGAAENRLGMAVAGRLSARDLRRLCQLEQAPEMFGVRGAVCAGGRTGRVCRGRVAEAAAAVGGVCHADRARPFA